MEKRDCIRDQACRPRMASYLPLTFYLRRLRREGEEGDDKGVSGGEGRRGRSVIKDDTARSILMVTLVRQCVSQSLREGKGDL